MTDNRTLHTAQRNAEFARKDIEDKPTVNDGAASQLNADSSAIFSRYDQTNFDSQSNARQQVLEQQKARLKEAKNQIQDLLHSAGEGIVCIDLLGKITFANPKACSILEIEYTELLQRRMQDFLPLNQDDIHTLNKLTKAYHESPQSLMQNWHANRVLFLLNSDAGFSPGISHWKNNAGTVFHSEYSCHQTIDSNGNCVGAVITFQDFSQRHQLEEKLVEFVNYDPLTNLANRAYFHMSLRQDLAQQRQTNSCLALLLLDLDHFKYINDRLGYDAGDQLLRHVVDRIKSNIQIGDLVARLGGDEFAIILHDVNKTRDAGVVAKQIIAAVAEPMQLASNEVSTSVSIGIALAEDHESTMDDLLKAADTAMHTAKKQGRNNYKFFAEHMQSEAESKQRIQIMLHQAITNEELFMVYQPKVSLSNKKMVGFEALLRWQPKQGTPIGPETFIPIAEESGQIIELGEWVLRTVCQQIKQWQTLTGFKDMKVGINVSTRQLHTGGFHDLLQQVIKENGIAPHWIEIEVTETGVLTNPEIVIKELQKVHGMGISISIDDFGTGNSSLDHLRKLPLDVLKIDRSFIQDIGVDRQDEEIIRVVVAIAHTLGLEVVAEGGETPEQLDFLANINCDLLQGYFFSKPLSALEMTALINTTDLKFLDKFVRYEEYQRLIRSINALFPKVERYQRP